MSNLKESELGKSALDTILNDHAFPNANVTSQITDPFKGENKTFDYIICLVAQNFIECKAISLSELYDIYREKSHNLLCSLEIKESDYSLYIRTHTRFLNDIVNIFGKYLQVITDPENKTLGTLLHWSANSLEKTFLKSIYHYKSRLDEQQSHTDYWKQKYFEVCKENGHDNLFSHLLNY